MCCKTLGLKPKNSCTWRSKKNEGDISAPSETCKDFETDAAFLSAASSV